MRDEVEWWSAAGAAVLDGWLAARGLGRVPDHRRLEALPLDSMDRVELALRYEEATGARFPEAAAAEAASVGALRAVLAAPPQGGAPLLGEGFEGRPDAAAGSWLTPLSARQAAVSRRLHRGHRALMRRLFALRVDGLDGLPGGQVVFTPNHVSLLDPMALVAALPHEVLRRTFWAETVEYLTAGPLHRGVGRLVQAFPVDQRAAPARSVARALAVLERGDSLVWFPEGERSTAGGLLPFRHGIGLLLERRPVPVVPVAILGTRRAWPAGRTLPRRAAVRVVLGAPRAVAPRGRGRSGWAATAAACRAELAALLRDVAQGDAARGDAG